MSPYCNAMFGLVGEHTFNAADVHMRLHILQVANVLGAMPEIGCNWHAVFEMLQSQIAGSFSARRVPLLGHSSKCQ